MTVNINFLSVWFCNTNEMACIFVFILHSSPIFIIIQNPYERNLISKVITKQLTD